MSHQLPLESGGLGTPEPASYEPRAGALRRRRAEAARVRRRRLALADLSAGAALAIAGLLLAPGLAILALAALLALAGCGAWLLAERFGWPRRGRRRLRRGRRR